MEVRTTNCRSCLEALHQGIPADTSTKQKKLERTAPLKVCQTVWIFKDFTPRGLWSIGRISAIDDNDTQQPRQHEVKTNAGTFKIPGIRLAPIEAEERLHHDDSDEEAKIIPQ